MSWNYNITDKPKVNITRSIPANVEKCWDIIRIFNQLPGLPKEAITSLENETKNYDQVGFVRLIKIPVADLDISESLRSLGT